MVNSLATKTHKTLHHAGTGESMVRATLRNRYIQSGDTLIDAAFWVRYGWFPTQAKICHGKKELVCRWLGLQQPRITFHAANREREGQWSDLGVSFLSQRSMSLLTLWPVIPHLRRPQAGLVDLLDKPLENLNEAPYPQKVSSRNAFGRVSNI